MPPKWRLVQQATVIEGGECAWALFTLLSAVGRRSDRLRSSRGLIPESAPLSVHVLTKARLRVDKVTRLLSDASTRGLWIKHAAADASGSAKRSQEWARLSVFTLLDYILLHRCRDYCFVNSLRAIQ